MRYFSRILIILFTLFVKFWRWVFQNYHFRRVERDFINNSTTKHRWRGKKERSESKFGGKAICAAGGKWGPRPNVRRNLSACRIHSLLVCLPLHSFVILASPNPPLCQILLNTLPFPHYRAPSFLVNRIRRILIAFVSSVPVLAWPIF